MITFYPGPSKIYEQVKGYFSEGLESGIFTMNHRSTAFMELLSSTVDLLHTKLDVPDDYSIIFTSSATECWEITGQSLVAKKSAHIYNGAFGEKWLTYTRKLGRNVLPAPFDLNEYAAVPDCNDCDTICFTQNETSNGTMVINDVIREARDTYDNAVIAVDITSSMAGVKVDFKAADVWFASVQKCFGLPAGMAVLVLSPKAVERAKMIGENEHYNSLNNLMQHARKDQTAFTPNISSIYLLKRLLEDIDHIDQVQKRISSNYHEIKDWLIELNEFDFLVTNEQVRSLTVIAVTSKIPMENIKNMALQKGIVLGNGYGEWKQSTFRIANFPAINAGERVILKKFLYEIG